MELNICFSDFVKWLFPIILLTGCTGTKKSTTHQTIVGNVGNDSVTLQELKNNFQPTQDIKKPTQEGLINFLPVYLTYKAKIKEARQAGYFDDSQIINEYKNYARQAAYSYWIEHVISDTLLDQLYKRSQIELKASHMLIRLSPNASPSDTLHAYNKLMEARKKYQAGASFDALAQQYSTRVRGRSMGGELGYITGGQTIKSFEDALYNLKVDSVSMPVRSKYGYHLIHLEKRRPRKADRKVSHIFFLTKGPGNTIDSALKRAQIAYQKLENGMPWDTVAVRYSEDQRTKNKGGKIGWINYGRFKEAFVDSIMAIDQPHTYTKPFYSGYGVHIIRLDSIRHYQSVKQQKDELMKKLKQLPRFKNKKQNVVNHIRKLGNEKVYPESLSQIKNFFNQHDSTRIDHLSFPADHQRQTIYTLEGQNYKAGDFLQWIKNEHGQDPSSNYNNSWFDGFVEKAVNDHIVSLTRKKYPEFGDKVKNYMDGLVVFQISQDSIWSSTTVDSSDLRKLYQKKPDDYRYAKRYHYYLISSGQDSLLKAAREHIKHGMSPDTIDTQIKGLYIRSDSSSYVDDFPFTKLSDMQEGTCSGIFKYKKQNTFLYLKETLDPRRMTFKEAYNQLMSDYQPIREKEWKSHLEHKYSIKSYPERIRNASNNKLTSN